MQRNLTKIRAKALPSSPNNADEITKIFKSEFVRKHYGETLRKNEEEKTMFFKHATQSEEYAMCIFAAQDIINAINVNIEVQDRQLFMDGTFKVREIFCPTLYCIGLAHFCLFLSYFLGLSNWNFLTIADHAH